MFRKLRKPLFSLSSASTVILPTVPSCVVTTSKSVDIGGRDTLRTTCDQNLLNVGEPTHSAAQRLCASPVNATDFPSPVCHHASTGSFCLPAVSGISICGSCLRLVRIIPRSGG